MSEKRFKKVFTFNAPMTLIIGGERFPVRPPAAFTMFEVPDDIPVDEEWPEAHPSPYKPSEWHKRRDRFAFIAGGAVIAVARRTFTEAEAGRVGHVEPASGDPGDYFVELNPDVTRVRRDYRKRLARLSPYL